MTDKVKLLKELSDKAVEMAQCRAEMFAIDKRRYFHKWLDCKARLALIGAEHQRLLGLISIAREERRAAAAKPEDTRVPNVVLRRLLHVWHLERERDEEVSTDPAERAYEDAREEGYNQCLERCIADLGHVMGHHDLPDDAKELLEDD